jgi:hypothetical protein
MLESLYLGIPALCLVSAGITGGREARFWGLVLLLALVVALGSSTPLFPFLYRAAPPLFGKLRYPEKFLLLFHVSVVMLAAGGLAKLETGRSTASLAPIIVAGFLFVTGVALWWIVRYDPRTYLSTLFRDRGANTQCDRSRGRSAEAPDRTARRTRRLRPWGAPPRASSARRADCGLPSGEGGRGASDARLDLTATPRRRRDLYVVRAQFRMPTLIPPWRAASLPPCGS